MKQRIKHSTNNTKHSKYNIKCGKYSVVNNSTTSNLFICKYVEIYTINPTRPYDKSVSAKYGGNSIINLLNLCYSCDRRTNFF